MTERLNWRTSSYTKSDSCVEVADDDPGQVVVRDTKCRDRAIIGMHPVAWAEFVRFVRQPD
ncbi:DUF397 domain-containing protein [Streptomyces goshikiensis]